MLKVLEKRIVICFLLVIVSQMSFGQTYSTVLNSSNGQHNTTRDIEIFENSLYISSYSCRPGIYVDYGCNSMFKLNLNGDMLAVQSYDSLFAKNFANLDVKEDKILMSGIWLYEKSRANPATVLSIDSSLNETGKFVGVSNPDINPKNSGIFYNNGFTYIFGHLESLTNDVYQQTNIVKIDKELNGIKNDFRTVRAFGPPGFNDCQDLQITREGDLIYGHHFKDNIGAVGEGGLQIMLIDTFFNKIDSFEVQLENSEISRLLASKEGAIYFNSKNHPVPSNNFPSKGRINKLNSTLDTLLWSLELPFDNFTNSRKYDIFDFIQADNGDIIACGSVWDLGHGSSTPDATFHGFVTRVTQNGEFSWLRMFRLPNSNPIIPANRFGKYMQGGLYSMLELDDGRIVLGGTASATHIQWNRLLVEGDTLTYNWILTVDANGCIEGEECQEVITLDGEIINSISGSLVDHDNQWNEASYGIVFGEVESRRYTFDSDSSFRNGNWYTELLISSDEVGSAWTGTDQYFRMSGSQVYELIDDTDYLLYDFALNVGDTFTVEPAGSWSWSRDLVVTTVDSIVLMDQTKRKRLIFSCMDGTGEIVWVEGIGDLRGLLSVKSSCILDINEQLLCYSEQGEVLYQDPDEGECWLTTSTEDPLPDDFSLYPNPASDRIFISGERSNRPMEFTIYSSVGVNIRSGKTADGSISVSDLPQGVYLIEWRQGDKKTTSRFVKGE
jgi:hypothetical protein